MLTNGGSRCHWSLFWWFLKLFYLKNLILTDTEGLKKGPNLADFVLKKEIERFKLQYIDSSSKPKFFWHSYLVVAKIWLSSNLWWPLRLHHKIEIKKMLSGVRFSYCSAVIISVSFFGKILYRSNQKNPVRRVQRSFWWKKRQSHHILRETILMPP
jgi:hypothetical protein